MSPLEPVLTRPSNGAFTLSLSEGEALAAIDALADAVKETASAAAKMADGYHGSPSMLAAVDLGNWVSHTMVGYSDPLRRLAEAVRERDRQDLDAIR